MYAKKQISSPLKKRIAIYAEYVDNNGDLIFGCKLAESIQLDYPDDQISVCTIPKMHTTTTENRKGMMLENTGKLRDLNRVNKFPITHMDDYVDNNNNKLDMVVIGPVVLPGCVLEIERLGKMVDQNTKILLISEYGFPQEALETTKKTLEKMGYINVAFQATGVTDKKGIFINHEIRNFDSKNPEEIQKVSAQLGAIGSLLHKGSSHENNLSDYLAHHELAVHYSHNNADKLVGVHTRYVEANKDSDLIVLGESAKMDRTALEKNIEILKEKGFAKVMYVDPPNEADTFYDSGKDGPIYRIIHTGRVSLEQSIALRKISGEFSGATGDQSYSEALSRSPIVIYETQVWKKDFLKDQIDLANEIDSSGHLARAIELMGSPDTTEEQYDELAGLLKQQNIREGLQKYRQVILSDRCLQDKIDPHIAEVHRIDNKAAKKSSGEKLPNENQETPPSNKRGFNFSEFKNKFTSLISKDKAKANEKETEQGISFDRH